MLNRFPACRWLQVCLVLIFAQSIQSEMQCSDPPSIDNGKHQLHSEMNSLPILGSTIVYSCNVGYELENDIGWEPELITNLTCELQNENRTAYWKGNVPKCKQMQCSDPPAIDNGKHQLHSEMNSLPILGSTIVYSCNVGYELEYDMSWGPELVSNLTCELKNENRTAYWRGDVPKCKKMQCPYLPVIENGKRQLHSEMNNIPILGSTVVYSCNVGYELVVNDMSWETEKFSNLTCDLEEGNNTVYWKGNMPKCKKKVMCDDPGVSVDGQRDGNCCFPDDVLSFSCNEGFQLVGENETQCLSDGSWSFRRPLCRPLDVSCDLPPAIMHGIVTGDRNGDYYLPWEEVEVLCEPGYSYTGPSRFIMCEEEGQWEAVFSNCTEHFCDLPEPLANGIIIELESKNITKLPYNFELTYVCDKGYRIVKGDNTRFCDSDGWSGCTPYCSVILCPDPGTPENGIRRGYSYEVGAKVHFRCFIGYYLVGSFERHCMPNGQWTGELARCDSGLNYCPNPGIPINGFKNSSNYDMGDIVSFRCRQGYIQLGSEERQCLPNHTWSGTITTCVDPYGFDNIAHVRDRLKVIISEKIAEQKYELQKYEEFIEAQKLILDKMFRCNHLGRLIFYFVFDVSRSIGRNNFQRSITFAKAIVNRIGISKNGFRVGALTFGLKSEIQFLPFNYSTTEEVIDALDKINYTGEERISGSFLTLLREECIPLTKAEKYCTERQKSIVFILSDGKSYMGGFYEMEAKILKDNGVEIYCIGITGDVQKEALYRIASDSTEESHVFILENYAALSWLTQEISNETIDYSQCGLQESAGNSLLAESWDTQPWPWMVYVYFRSHGSVDRTRDQRKCGGSIINEFFILTAAHCMYNSDLVIRDVKEVIVKFDLRHVKNKTFVREPEVKSFIVHPKYKPGNYDYDIALLQLTEPIQYNSHVRPICLPPIELLENGNLYKPSEYVLVPGYAYHWWSRSSDIYLPIQSREVCNQSFVKNGFDANHFTDRMFCAGGERGENGICRDFNGEHLMQSQLNEEGYLYWIQVGIASWGFGCNFDSSYIVYSHVSNLRLWIDQQIKDALLEEL